MPRNVEIKARLRAVEDVRRRAAALAASPLHEVLEQDDTFFACADGRLKLRQFDAVRGELIWYDRADTAGPKASDYGLVRTREPAALRAVLTAALGARGRVRKTRHLYHVGRTRVHIDHVEGLGDFLELEVVLADDERPEDGAAEARELMDALGVAEDDLVAGAYVDLLAARSEEQER